MRARSSSALPDSLTSSQAQALKSVVKYSRHQDKTEPVPPLKTH
jgi:hypothetical protein